MDSANAQCEVIKAKTIENINEIQTSFEEEKIPTFNDPELPNFSNENSLGTKIENKTRNFFNKKKRKKQAILEGDLEDERVIEDDKILKTQKENEQEEIVADKNKFQINADKINYDDNSGNVYAKGHVEIIAKPQKITLKGDEAVLDKASQTLKLHKNVKVIKDGVVMSGEYLLVDLNEQNILMDNPTINAYSFVIKAQESFLIANDLQILNGTIKSTRQQDIILESSGFQRFENVSIDYIKNKNMIRQTNGQAKPQTYRINAKEIVLTSYKDHNAIVLKGSNIYYNKHKVVHNSDIEIISDKQQQNIETNTPEAGTLRNFGTYIGYGLVYRMPKGNSLKVMPALTLGDGNLGIGVIGRYRTNNSRLDAGWNTSTTNLVVRGKYRFNNELSLSYGRNSYLPEGFMGSRRSGYAAQLEYQKSLYNEDLDVRFNNGVYAGIFSDYQKHDQENAYATTRFRYMAELRKTFFKFKNQEQDLAFSSGLIAQGSATVYGSGETAGVARIGPFITTKLKCWESSIAYFLTGEHGESPFEFDRYRYGKSTISMNEKFNFGDKFALGFRVNVSPLKDNYKKDLLTETRFYAIIGPPDLKFILSYDFVRDIAHLDMMFLLGTNSAKIDFEKLTTKNLDGTEEKQRDFYKNAKPVKIEAPKNLNL